MDIRVAKNNVVNDDKMEKDKVVFIAEVESLSNPGKRHVSLKQQPLRVGGEQNFAKQDPRKSRKPKRNARVQKHKSLNFLF